MKMKRTVGASEGEKNMKTLGTESLSLLDWN